MNLVKTINAIQTIDTSCLIKRNYYNTKNYETKLKILDHDHDICVTTEKCNELTSVNFDERSKQANLPSKNDIADFVKKRDFNDKLKNINKKVISNKTRHIKVNKKPG